MGYEQNVAKFTLKKVLEERGWSQYKLAKELDVSVGEVYRWCQGNYNPTLKTLTRISEVMNLPIEDFLEQKQMRKSKA